MRCKNIILYIITMIISVANACYATESSTSNSDRAESETMENQQKPLCDQHPVTKLSKEEIEKKRSKRRERYGFQLNRKVIPTQ